jgi:hypothetical protein
MRRPKRPALRVNRLLLGGVLGCWACASPCGRPDVSAKKSLALCSVIVPRWSRLMRLGRWRFGVGAGVSGMLFLRLSLLSWG